MSIRPLLAVALAGAALAAPAAQAATNCFGPSTMYACVTTPTLQRDDRTECIYAGGTTCQNVTIPWYTINGTVNVYCGGDAWRCDLL